MQNGHENGNGRTADHDGATGTAANPGTGPKTVVMGALIVYHFFNRLEYRSDVRFADNFLLVAPGVTIRITDPQGKVKAPMLLDVVQELRDAGAEAIQVGDVRVVASTWFGAQDGALRADGKPLSAPYVVKAIGDPATMDAAMRIPGGVVESMRQEGADAAVARADSITVDALATPAQPRHAQPVPAPTTGPAP